MCQLAQILSSSLFLFSFSCVGGIFVCACFCMYFVCVWVLPGTCHRRTGITGAASPFWLKFRSSGLQSKSFTCWAIAPSLEHFFPLFVSSLGHLYFIWKVSVLATFPFTDYSLGDFFSALYLFWEWISSDAVSKDFLPLCSLVFLCIVLIQVCLSPMLSLTELLRSHSRAHCLRLNLDTFLHFLLSVSRF